MATSSLVDLMSITQLKHVQSHLEHHIHMSYKQLSQQLSNGQANNLSLKLHMHKVKGMAKCV